MSTKTYSLDAHMHELTISPYSFPQGPLPPTLPPRTVPVVGGVGREAQVGEARINGYFEEQRRIGSERPHELYPMKYDISIYNLAEAGCSATIDSPDWRRRELSIRITDATIDVMKKFLRKPLAKASQEFETSSLRLTSSDCTLNKEGKWVHQYWTWRMSSRDSIPDFKMAKLQDTRCEYKRFKIYVQGSDWCISVITKKLREIAEKILLLEDREPKPGRILFEEILRRIENIFYRLMDLDLGLILNPFRRVLLVKYRMQVDEKRILCTILANETARQLFKKRMFRGPGMDPRLVDLLIDEKR